MKFAAIDIGSNAVRLLLAQVVVDANLVSCRKESLIRLPLRLGDDAFTQGRISEAKVEKLIQALIGFQHLITVYEPIDFMACATSAMREAATAKQDGDLDATIEKLEVAVESIYDAIDTLSDVVRDQSDRGLIATLNNFGYKPLVAEYEKVLEEAEK